VIYSAETVIDSVLSFSLLFCIHFFNLSVIFSGPPRMADIAVYILTGIFPVEAQMHIRALGLFNNICHQAEDSSEKALQLFKLRSLW
jgi:hypothetical protein